MNAIFGIVAGLILGVLLITVAEAWLLALQPPPDHWITARALAYSDWLEALNGRYKLMLLSIWMIAGAGGGMLAAALAGHPGAGWICGLLLAASAFLLTSLVYHPYWLSVLLIISPLIGAVCGSHFVHDER